MPETICPETSCCDLQQVELTTKIGGLPLFDNTCCNNAHNYVPKDGIVIERGMVVFFTGNVIEIDGQKFEEVDIEDADKGIAGVSMWEIDNSNSDTGSVQFLVKATLMEPMVILNGASIADMRLAGLLVENVSR